MKRKRRHFPSQTSRDYGGVGGNAHVGGDVIALHQKHYHFKTRIEAITSLARILNMDETVIDFTPRKIKVDESVIKLAVARAEANDLAKDIDGFTELDYHFGWGRFKT